MTHWSAALLGDFVRRQGLQVSDRTVGRILADADLQPHRQRMWLTSHDDEFRNKRDDVLHLYYDPPADEHVICLDEKTGMQALERRFPDIAMAPGQPVRREFEYVRHGTLCLMGAYDVRRRKLFGFVSEDHDAQTFIDLLEVVNRCYPNGRSGSPLAASALHAENVVYSGRRVVGCTVATPHSEAGLSLGIDLYSRRTR